jgi:hypothetical protein
MSAYVSTYEYRLSDLLPDSASDSAYVSQYEYLWRKNPSWLMGLKRPDGKPYYTPARQPQAIQEAA